MLGFDPAVDTMPAAVALIWNERHPRYALREYERHYNLRRTHP